jgi:sortase A
MVTEITKRPDWVIPDPGDGYAPKHTDAPPVDKDPLPTPRFGETWAILHVPRWGYDYRVPIVEDTDRKRILNEGVIGHYVGTAGPGQIGNFATAAHRTTYGAPYSKVEEVMVEDGDLAIVETDDYYFVYKAYGSEAVFPHEVRVVWPVPNEENAVPTKRLFTMTTCHPPYSARQRFVVWFEMAYWAEKSEGTLEDLVPPDQRK